MKNENRVEELNKKYTGVPIDYGILFFNVVDEDFDDMEKLIDDEDSNVYKKRAANILKFVNEGCHISLHLDNGDRIFYFEDGDRRAPSKKSLIEEKMVRMDGKIEKYFKANLKRRMDLRKKLYSSKNLAELDKPIVPYCNPDSSFLYYFIPRNPRTSRIFGELKTRPKK